MKKICYYLSPLVLLPIFILILDFIETLKLFELTTFTILTPLFLIAIIIGNLTPTKKIFDFIIAIIVPVGLFVALFILGLLDTGETYSRFTFEHAIRVPLEFWPWYIYLSIAIATLFASFKPLRIFKKKN